MIKVRGVKFKEMRMTLFFRVGGGFHERDARSLEADTIVPWKRGLDRHMDMKRMKR